MHALYGVKHACALPITQQVEHRYSIPRCTQLLDASQSMHQHSSTGSMCAPHYNMLTGQNKAIDYYTESIPPNVGGTAGSCTQAD